VFHSSLPVIVIMIDSSEKYNCKLSFSCYWKVELLSWTPLTPSLLCQDALMAKISMLVFIVLSIKEQLKSWTWLACAWLLLSCVSFSPKTENIPITSPTKHYLAWTSPNPFKNVFNPLDSVQLWSLLHWPDPF